MPESTTRSLTRDSTLTGVYAIIGCDGTGKSTLARDLLISLRKTGPVRRRYMGLISGEAADKIKDLPFIGVRLERNLQRKRDRALDMEKQLPGTGTALIMYLLSLWRAILLLRVRWLSRRGVQIIADRYPQAEIPGFHYDGPGLAAGRTDTWFVRMLAKREQKMYEWMALHKPALIIRLNIDAEAALARKPDHNISELRDKISVIPLLTFNGARVHDIDATIPYAQVLESALQAISQAREVAADSPE
jgi:thymidylate kinase